MVTHEPSNKPLIIEENNQSPRVPDKKNWFDQYKNNTILDYVKRDKLL